VQVALSALENGHDIPKPKLRDFLVDAARLAKSVESQMQSCFHEKQTYIRLASAANLPEA
jgi:hypothetical protein